MKGTTPEGARSEQEAATWVRGMFGRVAHRYDLANHLLSANIDRLWRARTVARVRDILRRPGARVMDLACGTGDLLVALERDAHRALLGSDFCHPMLAGAKSKLARLGLKSTLVEADALALPLPDASLDLITIAFGFRNLANYEAGLREFARVLKPGGQIGILDFSEPGGLMGKAYGFYFRHILPTIGRIFTGPSAPGEVCAYSYLPASVQKFPSPPEMLRMMHDCGYVDCTWRPYTFGIAGLYSGVRAPNH